MKNKLKEIREEKGLSQLELAEKSGVARTIINQLETGKRDVIKSETMIKISKALGKTLDDIFLI